MSDFGWNTPGAANEGERGGLPRVEDLKRVDGGYDRRSVEQAFDAFYRHAAQLDANLRVLESVEAFRRDSAALRDDLRALRSASWGPIPAARQPWSTSASASWRTERRASFDAMPRIVVEAAFIVAVALAAGLSGLATGWVVTLVLASWVLVGLGELALAVARPRPSAPAVLPPPRRMAEPTSAPIVPVVAEPEPEAVPAPVGEDTQASELEAIAESEPEPVAEEEPEPELEPEPVAEEASEPEPQPEPVAELEPELGPVAEEPEPEPEHEPVAEEPEPEPEPVAEAEPEPVADVWPEPEAVAEAEPEPDQQPEPDLEPAPAEAAVASWAATQPEPRRRRFWGRRQATPEPVADPEPEPSRHVRIVPVETEEPEQAAEQEPVEEPEVVAEPEPAAEAEADPWDEEPVLPPGPLPDNVETPWEAPPETEAAEVDLTDEADTDTRLELPAPRQERAALRRGRR